MLNPDSQQPIPPNINAILSNTEMVIGIRLGKLQNLELANNLPQVEPKLQILWLTNLQKALNQDPEALLLLTSGQIEDSLNLRRTDQSVKKSALDGFCIGWVLKSLISSANPTTTGLKLHEIFGNEALSLIDQAERLSQQIDWKESNSTQRQNLLLYIKNGVNIASNKPSELKAPKSKRLEF